MTRKYWILSLFVLFLAGPALAQGNAEKGQPYFLLCQTCHGDNGAGNQSLGAPRIAGQHGWYLQRQLQNFKAGVRGAHADDSYGMQMAPMAQTLPDDQAVLDVVAYIGTLEAPAAAPTDQGGKAEKGQPYFALCQTCHGENGTGNKDLNAPRIAGQHGWYLQRQLQNFKAGIRGAHADDLYGQTMAPMAQTLPDDQAVLDVVAYIQSLK